MIASVVVVCVSYVCITLEFDSFDSIFIVLVIVKSLELVL